MKKLSYALLWLMSLTTTGCYCEVWEHHDCHDQSCDDGWDWDNDWDWDDDWDDDAPGGGGPGAADPDAGGGDVSSPECETDADCDLDMYCHLESGCCEPAAVCEAEADCEPGFNCDQAAWLCLPADAERCSELADETSCVERDDCEPVYAGVRCSCGAECTCMGGEPGCVCEDFEFFRCGTSEAIESSGETATEDADVL